jgi:hypothetical protein
VIFDEVHEWPDPLPHLAVITTRADPEHLWQINSTTADQPAARSDAAPARDPGLIAELGERACAALMSEADWRIMISIWVRQQGLASSGE